MNFKKFTLLVADFTQGNEFGISFSRKVIINYVTEIKVAEGVYAFYDEDKQLMAAYPTMFTIIESVEDEI